VVKDFGQVPPVLATEGKLSQVFLNLIINAAHAIGDGNAEENCITIRTWAEGDDVFAEVSDTGRGIPPENLERIFEPFFTTRKFGKGSGLGLSISRSIVSEFGGDHSRQERGRQGLVLHHPLAREHGEGRDHARGGHRREGTCADGARADSGGGR